MSVSLRAPFALEGGRVALVTNQTAQVEQKIVDVLVTNTLERCGNPEYGGNLTAVVFENTDTLAFEDFKVDVAQEISASVTGVTIVDIRWEEEDTAINVNVIYRLPLSTNKQFTFQMALPGTINEETPLA